MMNSTHFRLLALASLVVAACNKVPSKEAKTVIAPAHEDPVALEQVFADSTYQLTGVAVTKGDRLFVNYPYWLDAHSYSVVEVKDGKPLPYPNSDWNSFEIGQDGQDKFVCVQAVFADDQGYLWVVDAAGIGLGKVYQSSNKVVKINLATNAVERIYRFPATVAGEEVYLNDIRVDNEAGFAYLTDSNSGGIVVLDIRSGESRKVLANSPSVKSDAAYRFSPLGTELRTGDGSALKVNSDGIALSPDRKYLYFKPLTDDRLYRIETGLLRDFKETDAQISRSVEDLGRFVTTDGMIFDKQGNLYFGDLEANAMVKISPDLQMQTIVKDDEKLLWPDSYSISEDGYLYLTTSQIHLMPWFHQGQEKFKRPFAVYRIKL
ncbi:major royal jelly family protein [Algoriphagus oliviformis]|nr:major royal jelly family protein [Algoriphagus oliviformis]